MLEIYQPSEDSYLLSEAIKKLKHLKNKKVLEIGSGSGFQLQILKDLNVKNVFASDINPNAVKQCKSLGFKCVQSDLFENIKNATLTGVQKKSRPSMLRGRSARKIKGFPRFDLIIFNPPYLPKDTNEPETSALATTGGKKGSEIINRFLKQAKNYLKKNAKIILLTSSLTKNINWQKYKRKKIAQKSLFFEKLYVWEITLE
ncbi:hypothetical protein DRN73_04515 [Candidatus Pacearchaeota archaeon]|nr:MAG: hypothetical protein DRN73_04515 [Candidatus Pacearchaeota archaeon]